MELDAKTIIEIGQVVPGAKIEQQDARPILLPEFRQTVSVPAVLHPIANLGIGPKDFSFMFGNWISSTNSAFVVTGLTNLSPGFWRVQYNISFHVNGFATSGAFDYIGFDFGGTRHPFCGQVRAVIEGVPNTINYSNSFEVLLRDPGIMEAQIGATGAAETLYIAFGFNCQKLL